VANVTRVSLDAVRLEIGLLERGLSTLAQGFAFPGLTTRSRSLPISLNPQHHPEHERRRRDLNRAASPSRTTGSIRPGIAGTFVLEQRISLPITEKKLQANDDPRRHSRRAGRINSPAKLLLSLYEKARKPRRRAHWEAFPPTAGRSGVPILPTRAVQLPRVLARHLSDTCQPKRIPGAPHHIARQFLDRRQTGRQCHQFDRKLVRPVPAGPGGLDLRFLKAIAAQIRFEGEASGPPDGNALLSPVRFLCPRSRRAMTRLQFTTRQYPSASREPQYRRPQWRQNNTDQTLPNLSPWTPNSRRRQSTAATVPAQIISCSRKALAQKEARQRETEIGYR